MFGGYWGKDLGPWIVAGGLLFAAILLGAVWWTHSEIYEAVYHDHATGKAHADAQNIFDRECAQLTAVDDLRRCAKETVEAARATQRAEEDLYAQKQMANSAWWLLIATAFIGVITLGITGVGTYLLLKSINLNREAIKIAREEQRAWVRFHLDRAKIDHQSRDGEPWSLKISLTYALNNIGHQPAVGTYVLLETFRSGIPFAFSDAPDRFIGGALQKYKVADKRAIYPNDSRPTNVTMGGKLENVLDQPIEGTFLACVVV